MAKITIPYPEIDSRWPYAPCTLRCVISDESWVEIRFEPTKKKNPGTGGIYCTMRIYRTDNNGKSWIEIATKLKSWWQKFAYGEYWPPDPIDFRELLVEGDYMEAKISEVAYMYITGGEREWKAVYNPKKKYWSITKRA
jgi:hypothetical protein